MTKHILLILCATLALAPINANANSTHWSYRPIKAVTPPANKNIKHPIDRFIQAELTNANLTPMPLAGRLVLIRRLCFDLTGLGPTPKQIDRFLNDKSKTAYPDLIDRLLATRAYGERWAQHWLDLARFAETDGYEHDKTRNKAWRYRDWVIDAFNQDMPFDQFVRLQIAGDELHPNDESAALATGFLLSGPDMPDINLMAERRQMALNEITQNIGAVLLASQIGCAQCHDHRTDPISQSEYYAFQAYFAGAVSPIKNKPLGHYVTELTNKPPNTFILHRGDFRQPGNKVAPQIPTTFGFTSQAPTPLPPSATSSHRRSHLANSLTKKSHPIVARVMVNRIWQNLFGTGLVTNSSDFGTMTPQPRQLDLLNWLTINWTNQGSSIKSIIRQIVTSQTYRTASSPTDPSWTANKTARAKLTFKKLTAADPANALLGRTNRKRMEGEAIRDTMLNAANLLSDRTGGLGVRPPLPAEVLATIHKGHWNVSENEEDHRRRSIYLFTRRNLRYPLFEVFDRPDANTSCGRRQQSTTAPQALTLFNSDFSAQMAQAVATRASTTPNPIETSYRLILSRPPTQAESQRATDFTSQNPQALADLCLALFNSNAFIYID